MTSKAEALALVKTSASTADDIGSESASGKGYLYRSWQHEGTVRPKVEARDGASYET